MKWIRRINRVFMIALVVTILSGTIVAQDSSLVKLKAFVEGSIPDFNFLRNNINFVDFVNDPFASDIHIIVKRKSNNGLQTVNFINMRLIQYKNQLNSL